MPVRNLDHNTAPASSRERRATRSVQSLGTTAKRSVALGNPEWMADLEYVWRMRTHDALQRLHQRARRQRRRALRRRPGSGEPACTPARQVELLRSAEWAEHRAQAMALPRAEVVDACRTRMRMVRCKCGPREVPVGCDLVQLCEWCRKRHWRRWRRKITRALDAHVRAARGSWHGTGRRGRLPGVYLITLTVPHSGSIAVDRDVIGRGWRKLTKAASAGRWWGAYALTYEVTPGKDGLGHVHAHIAAVSSWIPYDDLHRVWREATGARVLDVSAPSGSTRRESAADYLAKYVTKGVDPTVFTGQKAGELLIAFRGKRKVSTSVGFWSPTKEREATCGTCGARHELVGAPGSLRTVAPGAVLQALAERVGWWIPRGAVQVVLRYDKT